MKRSRTGASTSLIASRLFLPEVSAASFRLGALARSLAARGDVAVVTSKPPRGTGGTVDDPRVRVSRWPVLRDRSGNVRGYVQYASFDAPLLFRILFRRFSVVISEPPPTTGLVVAFVCAVRRRPFAYYAADVWSDSVRSTGASGLVVRLMHTMERAAVRRAAVVLSVSDEVTERLQALGADPERIVTVGNGIDTEIFTDAVVPAAADERYFVYTGTMSEWQRPDVFVRAFAEIAREDPTVRMRFFGQGKVESDLRELAESLVPGRVTFGGVVSPVESAQWIRGAIASLVSIAPGLGYDFARPTKTYAAAGCGTPVLFAGAETGRELVRGAGLGEGVGFTPQEVAAAMRRLIDAYDGGDTDARRAQRADWARAHVSLAAIGERAADAVFAAAGLGTPGGRSEDPAVPSGRRGGDGD